MSSYIDIKYANLISPRLERFKIKKYNPYSATFRCPICGDSQKSKIKARGNFYQKQQSILFQCFNCGAARNIASFLRDLDPMLYKDYCVESFLDKEQKIIEPTYEHPKHLRLGSPLLKLKKISQLKPDHPAKLYVQSRKIPTNQHHRLFYCPKFAKWTNTMIPGKLKEDKDSPRLIIPFLDADGNLFGYQGRSFDPNDKIRYITIMLEDKEVKAFGLDSCNRNIPYYITEGPIDSMFLPNAIAMGGADINIDVVNENAIFVYDNEPRNPDIVKRINKVLANGYSACIWPQDMKCKDINDMIMSGLTTDEVLKIIKSNTYSGMIALVKFNEWKRN
jgi:transcription elongation factor Elf1